MMKYITAISSLNLIGHQRQDIRSLALFRILLGLYITYDILSRLRYGRMDLLWYTSTEKGSFLHPDDTPHRSPIHRIWFYRGSMFFQLIFGFGIPFLLAIMFALGYKQQQSSCCWTKLMLWFFVTAMQNRNMHVHDGSDTYVRHLLLWSCQVPLAQTWSLDSYWEDKKKNKSNNKKRRNHYSCTTEEGSEAAAILGLKLQFVLMYLGTILNRTIDMYGFSMLSRSKWLPPQLSAVYYTMHSSFAIRNNWLSEFIRRNFVLSQFMTLSAMCIELFAPLLLFLLSCRFIQKDNNTYMKVLQLGCIASLFLLHFGLLLVMNLPNWQLAAMSAISIWIPSWIWDSILQKEDKTVYNHKKTDEIITTEYHKEQLYNDDDGKCYDTIVRKEGRRKRSSILTYALLFYMLYNFGGERGWITKHDDGDIGEFLRFSQYWVMFASPPIGGDTATFTATMMMEGGKNKVITIDMWEWMKTKQQIEVSSDREESIQVTEMTHMYPSPRIERALSQWLSHNDIRRIRYFLNQLCYYDPKFQDLTLTWKHWKTITAVETRNTSERYHEGRTNSIKAECASYT